MYRRRTLRPSGGVVVGIVALIIATAGVASATSGSQPKPAAIALKTTKRVHVQGSEVRLNFSGSDGDVNHSIARCPRGSRVVSGGFTTITGAGETFISDGVGNGWWVSASNESEVTDGTVQAFAYCAQTGRAIVTSGQPAAGEDLAVVRANLAAERRMAALLHTARH